MQHGLFGSGHDLDLRSNFIFDFSGSYTSFDASERARYNGGKTIDLTFGVKSYNRKTTFLKISNFDLS